MIKTGILGGETMAAGELIRILINHPDVVLQQVASESAAGSSVDEVHRGLTGDTDLQMVPDFGPEGLDVVFICGEPWRARQWMERYGAECDAGEVRVIDLTGAFRNGDMDMVYGFPEHNRKALVRGARRASLPSPVAMTVELALFPLAKNMLLRGDITGNVCIASTENFENASLSATSKSGSPLDVALSTRLDPVAPLENRPDSDASAREAAGIMRQIQPSFGGAIRLNISRDNRMPRGITARIDVSCGTSLGEVRRLFDEAYEDHNFTYVVDRLPSVLDVANTNKCLISLGYPPEGAAAGAEQKVRVTVVLDNLLKGAAGNAVHCLNLLFGLSERTGLALKASAF